MSYLFFWRAKAQRRKEIGEVLRTLPSVDMLYVNLIFGVQKTPFASSRLCALTFFFSQCRKDLSAAVGRRKEIREALNALV